MTRIIGAYALGRTVFGAGLLVAPALSARLLAGEGAATPQAQGLVRGMGGRDLALSLGLAAAVRAGTPTRPWLLALVASDASDAVGVAATWSQLEAAKRVPGIIAAVGTAAAGIAMWANA